MNREWIKDVRFNERRGARGIFEVFTEDGPAEEFTLSVDQLLRSHRTLQALAAELAQHPECSLREAADALRFDEIAAGHVVYVDR